MRKKIRVQKGQSKAAYDKAFSNEQYCLRLLDRLEHPNIIPLLASYTYQGEHFFLFPTYELDLETFFESKTRFGNFRWDFTFFSSLRGLASALCGTHKLHLEEKRNGLDVDLIGYHHDLRPANVLVSQETFILADFGLGRLKPKDVSSQTQWKAGNGDYLAPECTDENFAHQDVGRAIDVWAFGCLMMEVTTYMEQGVVGLTEFRKSRLSFGRHPRWEESCFYDKDGHIKPTVQRWLAALTGRLLPAAPIARLVKLSSTVLKITPKDRPTAAELCAELGFISLRSHFTAILEAFLARVGYSGALNGRQMPEQMKLWFEMQRFIACGYILGLGSNNIEYVPFNDLDSRYDEILLILKALHHGLGSENTLPEFDEMRENNPAIGKSADIVRYRGDDVVGLVQSLWGLLSSKERRRAETAWLRATMDTEDINRLDDVEQVFKFKDDPVYEKGAAMAMMRRIRLAMDSNPTRMPDGFLVSRQEVRDERHINRHSLGIFKGHLPVLIERSTYSSNWEKVTPEQRTTVMALKAQGFSETTRPAARMRTLECIGFFEDTEEKDGYGFIYRIPEPEPGGDYASSTKTLLQLLRQPYENKQQQRPLLGDKFRLASALVQFVGDFHNLGWLHENFHSNNILFFNVNTSGKKSFTIPSQDLDQPYVVGLHKSRPGGKLWITTGPTPGSHFQDYQHPECLRTGRYRAAHDYYSLGLVLLEIGFWLSLRVWSKSPQYSGMDLEQFRQELVKNCVPRLGVEMGAVYRDAVQFCLDGTIDENDEDLDVTTEESFARKVIEPLEELKTAFI